MIPTSVSLLDRLRQAAPDAPAWQRLNDIYLPLIQAWLKRVPGIGGEVDDLAQEVLLVLVRELPAFERRRDGSFRAWLRQITLNRIRTFQKRRDRQPRSGGSSDLDLVLNQLEDPSSDLSRQWDRDHDQYVFKKLLEQVKPDFEPSTWEAFTLFFLQNQPAAEVAARLGLSPAAVMNAKYRVLKRLREEADGILD